MPIWAYLAAAIAGYLLGSLPTGYLVGRARGLDIRNAGSGNIGATNVFRVLGKPAGIAVMLVDVLKGLAAVFALIHFFPHVQPALPAVFGTDSAAPGREYLGIVAGLAAILGHNYTCWLGFKGGKGIATSAGVLLALMPAALAVCLAVWVLVLAVSRYVSLASIAAAAVLPLAVWITRGGPLLTGVGLILGALAIYTHRLNMRRLRDGTEHRFGRPKPSNSNPA
jgi:glycerol-3-phosphate acyltransferase PlsY